MTAPNLPYKQGDHVCLLYDSPGGKFKFVIPYLLEGIARGERVVYVTDEASPDQVRALMQSKGADVRALEERGALVFATKEDTYLQGGHFDTNRMISFLEASIEAALDAGYQGLRATGETAWVMLGVPGADQFLQYEARCNELYSSTQAIGICQYNVPRFRPAFLEQVIRTHPIVLYGDRVLSNHFFEPGEVFLSEAGSRTRVDWMLEQIVSRDDEKRAEDAVIALSTPVLKIAERMLLLPIVGEVTSRRAKQLSDQLLAAVRDERARIVILDLTGAANLDRTITENLLRTIGAAELLGARVILTGASSGLSSALVSLGVDLNKVWIAGDLQRGVEQGLAAMGRD